MSNPAHEKLFNDIARFIEDGRSLLRQGAMMELNGLDDQIRTLCEAVMSLTQDERITHADRLQYLLTELKGLGEEMMQQRDKMAEEIRGVPQMKKASTAYRVADSRDDFGRRGEEEE